MDTVISKTEWSTDYKGDRFRILVLDECSGSKLTECHHIQNHGDNTAKCMNGSYVINVPTGGTYGKPV